MNKIVLETTKINGELYYEILGDGKGIFGTYVFENALSEWMRAKQLFALQKQEVVKR